jgi:hypothetical protein
MGHFPYFKISMILHISHKRNFILALCLALCSMVVVHYAHAHTNDNSIQVKQTTNSIAVEEDEDVPFDDSTTTGAIMNWVVKIFLWFIYLTILVLVLAFTQWILVARSLWSWFGTLVTAFFYGLVFGRWFGYEASLIFFGVFFLALKFLLRNTKGKATRYATVKRNWLLNFFKKDSKR